MARGTTRRARRRGGTRRRQGAPEAGRLGLDLTLTAPGGSEHQTLVAERCETLVEVVALKVALAVDPTALLRSLASARTDAEGGADALRFAVRGAIGAGLGPLPDASAFASAAGSVEVPGWRAEIAGSAWLPRSAAYPNLPNVGASFALVTGAVRGCVVPAMGAFDFPLCAGGETRGDAGVEEVGGMLWSELDLDADAPLWTIGKDQHQERATARRLPLSSAAVAILRGVLRRDEQGIRFRFEQRAVSGLVEREGGSRRPYDLPL